MSVEDKEPVAEQRRLERLYRLLLAEAAQRGRAGQCLRCQRWFLAEDLRRGEGEPGFLCLDCGGAPGLPAGGEKAALLQHYRQRQQALEKQIQSCQGDLDYLRAQQAGGRVDWTSEINERQNRLKSLKLQLRDLQREERERLGT